MAKIVFWLKSLANINFDVNRNPEGDLKLDVPNFSFGRQTVIRRLPGGPVVQDCIKEKHYEKFLEKLIKATR